MRSIGNRARRGAGALVITFALAVVTLAALTQRSVGVSSPFAQQSPLPLRLTDAEFWTMVTEMSEPGGYFRSDNLVSNELTFQHVVPALQRTLGAGGVYLGVGPDQNFTYLVALRPRIAFVVDIRRGNFLQHLLYKALIEVSDDRADFLSRLFSRARPAAARNGIAVDSLFAAFDTVRADSVRFAQTRESVRQRLVTLHRFPLSAEDLSGIEYVLQAFFDGGPALTYSFGRGMGGYGMRGMPTYAELMTATDVEGVARGYLATEEHFQLLKQLERDNLIVPLVGDFAGDKALRSVGTYLKGHGATVSAIYTSNVEQYLFQNDEAWRRYYANVATLPLDDRSTFVRAVFNYGGYREPGLPRGPRSVTMLSSVQGVLAAVQGGRVQSYWDVIQLSASPVDSVPR